MFKPSLNITKISKLSDYFEIIDNTSNYPGNPTGWGVPNGPTNSGDITDVLIFTQFLGTEPQLQVIPSGSSIFTGVKITQSLEDGVYAIIPLYGLPLGLTAVSGTGNTYITTNITGAVFTSLLDGITHLASANEPSKLYKIKSLNSSTGTIELYETYTGTDTITRYYGTGVTMMLVSNCGEKALVTKIANFSLLNDGCSSEEAKDIMRQLILRQSSVIAFNCKDYAKAHKAASLLCSNNNSTPCLHC
jgi:hypothetical protein